MKNKVDKRTLRLAVGAALCAFVFVFCFARLVFKTDIRGAFNAADFDTSKDFVKIMDVGQADSILIYSNGCSAVIDTGLNSSVSDIAQELKSDGIRDIDVVMIAPKGPGHTVRSQYLDIDVVMISHLHMDHAGGTEGLARLFKFDNFIVPRPEAGADANSNVNAAKGITVKRNGRIYTAKQGMNFKIGEFTVTVLSYYDEFSDENDKSLVLMAEIDGFKFLFTGDAGSDTENALLDEGINVDCDVLKVGHHGSATASSERFIKAASPKYAAISVGENNVYSHPVPRVISSLKAYGAEVFRTDENGDITFYVENGKIKPETEK